MQFLSYLLNEIILILCENALVCMAMFRPGKKVELESLKSELVVSS